MNVALIGSNFALKGYLPVIKKIRQLKLKVLCNRNIKKTKKVLAKLNNIVHESNWKRIFTHDIDLIILAVPPRIQNKILNYNLKFRKEIIFEKPISQNLSSTKKIIKLLKKKRIKSDINLTFLNHELFHKTKDIIKNKKLGKVISYEILWNFRSFDLENKIKSWKTIEHQGGGIKNIFLTHVFSYCEFLFGGGQIIDYNFNSVNFKNISYKKQIYCILKNKNSVTGKITLFVKKDGYQNHIIKIKCEKGYIRLFTKPKDWTKDFILETYNNQHKIKKITKEKKINKFKDGRSNQIFAMIKNFLKKSNYTNIDYCLNAEKLNKTIN